MLPRDDAKAHKRPSVNEARFGGAKCTQSNLSYSEINPALARGIPSLWISGKRTKDFASYIQRPDMIDITLEKKYFDATMQGMYVI